MENNLLFNVVEEIVVDKIVFFDQCGGADLILQFLPVFRMCYLEQGADTVLKRLEENVGNAVLGNDIHDIDLRCCDNAALR